MYGAIIGDLAGSIYEFEQTKKVHPVEINKIIEDNSFFSDDTILTIAILDAILHDKNYEKYLKMYANNFLEYKPNYEPYFETIFSPGFTKWSQGEKEGNSAGNGAMMRISPIGYMFDTEEEIIKNAKLATVPSHNSKEAINAATTIALMIFYFRKGLSKEETYNKLNIIPEYKPFEKFNVTCSTTIGNCLYAIYISNSFEEAIKNTIKMGGDTDTNAAIVGSMAEALYGIDNKLIEEMKNKIPKEFLDILEIAYNSVKTKK